MKLFILLLTLLALSLGAADEKKSKNDEVDHIALAALLLKDGHYTRADETLAQVDLNDKEIDLIRYYTLRGLISTKQGRHAVANEQFRKAITSGQEEKSIHLYIAQNAFKLKEYTECLSALLSAGELAQQKPQLFALKAEAHWRLGQKDEALATLTLAQEHFKEYWGFYKQRFNYFVTLELYQSALEDAGIYLANAPADAKTTLSFIVALRKSGATDKAILLAEEANARHYDNAEITAVLAHLYLDKSMVQAAADLFVQAAIEERSYTKEAAEMLRRAHEFIQALYMNSQMLDTQEKLKQRIAIFLEFGAFERIVAAETALKRSGVLENEDMRYALAYAYYVNGDYMACETHLKMLTRPDLFQKATELRKNMEKCQNNHWECES